MPIALLLAKPFATLPTLLAAARALAPWGELIRTERVLAARARGAFLQTWFGSTVPTDGSYVRVALANRAELFARLQQVSSAGSAWAGAPSTTTPVAGLAGLLGGLLLSPVGLVGGLWQLLRFARFSVSTLVGALLWVAGVLLWVALAGTPGATVLTVAGVLSAAGLIGGLAALGLLDEYVAGIGAFAASVTALMRAGTPLLEQLAGPRGRVVNPLLRAVLVLGDRLAALGAQVLGAVAFVIDVVGPRLVPAAGIVVAIRSAVARAEDAVDVAVDSLRAELGRFTNGDLAVAPLVARLVGTVRQLIATVIEALELGRNVAVNTLTRGADRLEAALSGYGDDVGAYLTDAFTQHPTVKNLLNLTSLIADRKKGAPKPARPGLSDVLLPRVELPDPAKIIKELPAPEIPPLTWKAIEAEAARPQGAGIPRVLLELRARGAVSAMAQRPSIFAAQQAELRQALAANRLELGELAGAVFELLRTALAPALWSRFAPLVEPAVRGFVDVIYGDAAPAERPLPVLRPDDPVPVRPVIGTLRLHAHGAGEAQVRAWRDTLVTALQGQSYVVAPATWGR